MTNQLLAQQELLQRHAHELRGELGIDAMLEKFGIVHEVGSAALGVMVAKDIDITVAVDALLQKTKIEVIKLASQLAVHSSVREVSVRDDTGVWNTDPHYPDGLYLKLLCRDDWKFDIWFVDQPERQPDIAQLTQLRPLLTDTLRQTILEIKQSGVILPSYKIYNAVVMHGAKSAHDVSQYLKHKE